MEQMDISKHVQSAWRLTEEVTTTWTSRLAGSRECLECAEYLKGELSSFCDTTSSQKFDIRPGSFLGYIRINIVLYFIALVALLFGQIYVALIAANLSVLITVLQFFFYKEFVDFLFPQKEGRNVYGSIEPSGEVKQQIIISAHHDSAHIFNFLEKDPSTYNKKVLSATLTQLGLFFVSWILVTLDMIDILHPVLYWSSVGLLILASYNLYHLWYFYDLKKGTPGAGDNMICVAIAMEIGKYFSNLKKNQNPLKHTRLVIASWDAEECGLRGARAFVKKHKDDLQRIKTYNLNLECMYAHEELHFLNSDLNNFVPLSQKMAEEGVAIARDLSYSTKILSFPLLAGGTDAAEFAKNGIEATTLVAMSWEKRDHTSVYHTTRDILAHVDQEAVRRSIEIGREYVLRKDEELVLNGRIK